MAFPVILAEHRFQNAFVVVMPFSVQITSQGAVNHAPWRKGLFFDFWVRLLKIISLTKVLLQCLFHFCQGKQAKFALAGINVLNPFWSVLEQELGF